MKYYIESMKLLCLVVLASITTCYAVDPTFHLKNNSSGEIQYELMQQTKSLTGGVKTVAKGHSGKFHVDISKPTILYLYYCLTAESCKTKLPQEGSVHKTKVNFPAGKTIYIKFDGKHITSQKGTKNQTSEGYNTEHNVTNDDIVPVHSEVPKNRTL